MVKEIPKELLSEQSLFSPEERIDREKRNNATVRLLDVLVSPETTQFKKIEVVELLKHLAEEEKIDTDKLEIVFESYNAEGILIELEMVYRGDVFISSIDQNFNEIIYGYCIRNPESSAITMVSRVYRSDDMQVSRGGIIGKYDELKHVWNLTPGKIAPNATDLR